jgi:hypothetical protein
MRYRHLSPIGEAAEIVSPSRLSQPIGRAGNPPPEEVPNA